MLTGIVHHRRLSGGDLPALTKLLKDDDRWVRRRAAEAVAAVGGASDAAAELAAMFHAGDQLDVVTAALVEAGEKGSAAMRQGLKSNNEHVRLWAHAGMAKANVDADRHVRAIVDRLAGASPCGPAGAGGCRPRHRARVRPGASS